MPVTNTHEDYDKHINQWKRCRDAYEGEDTIKASNEKYLPLLTGHENAKDKKYIAYKERALWFSATKRFVIGKLGAIFRKDTSYEGYDGEQWDALFEDVTLTGMSMEQFERLVTRELTIVSRYGILADIADASEDRRPKLCGYMAENITNWETGRVGSEIKLTMVVLREFDKRRDPDKADDPFARVIVTRYRELYLDPVAGEPDEDGNQSFDWIYRFRVWEEETNSDTQKKGWRVVDEGTPEVFGEVLDFIPFKFINALDHETTPSDPSILGLVDLNLDHYRMDADHKNGLHVSGNPTPVFAGFTFAKTDAEQDDDDSDFVPIGSEWGLTSEDANAKAYYMEFEGQGLDPLKVEKQDDEKRMAAMGARLLEQPVTQAEAAMAIQFKHAGEHGAMAGEVSIIETAIEDVLGWVAQMAAMPERTRAVGMNRDYFGGKMDPTMLTAIVNAWLKGLYDDDVALWNLEQGEMLPPGDTVEDVKKRMSLKAPVIEPLPDDDDEDDDEEEEDDDDTEEESDDRLAAS